MFLANETKLCFKVFIFIQNEGKKIDNISMRLFEKKETPVQNIAFSAIMVAINALASLLSSFVPLSSLFVVIFLPLVSAFASSLLKKIYMPIYLLASIAISLLSGMYDLSNVIFYIIPAIISGTLYGLLSSFRIPLGILIFLVSLLNMGLNYLTLPILKAIYGVDFIESAITLIGLSDRPHIYEIVPCFIFVLSLVETSLSNLVIQLEFKKLNISRVDLVISWFIYPCMAIVSAAFALGLGFVNLATGAIFLLFSVYFTFLSLVPLIRAKTWWLYLMVAALCIISFMLNAILNKYYPEGGKLLLIGFYSFSVAFPSLLGRILLILKERKAKND